MTVAEVYVAAFVSGFSGAMMPGPLLAVDITESTRHGWLGGFLCSFGHALAEIPVVILFAVGLTAITRDSTTFRVISVVGGAALIAMAALMIRDLITNRVSYDQSAVTTASASARPSRWSPVGKAFMASVVNPFWIVWWATAGLGFVSDSKVIGALGPAVFYSGHISADLVWYCSVSVLIWSGRKLILGRPLKIFLYCCAGFLVWLGVVFIREGMR